MSSPHRRGQAQQEEDDKSVMKVTVVSCKGERPSESVINVHIDGINPNANSPQIDKFMRRLTKNVVKIQNEIESQNNTHRKQVDSASDSLTDSDLQDIKPSGRERKPRPNATNACEGEGRKSPACRYQNDGSPAKVVLQSNLPKGASPQIKSNAPVKSANSNTDIVMIYSNKLINKSCDSGLMDDWVKHDSNNANPISTQQPCRRKRSLSCNNMAAQRGNAIQVFQVNVPGTSLQKDDDGVGQEDTETDDISLSTVSAGEKSSCSCCRHHLIVPQEEMHFGDMSNSTIVMPGKSSNSSAFKCCATPNKRRNNTTTTKNGTQKKEPGKVGTKGKNKHSSDEVSTDADASSAMGSAAEEKRRASVAEKEILEKQNALLNEKAKNEELNKKTEEQNRKIWELNRKLDELFRKNAEMESVNAEEARRKAEDRKRIEDENAKRIEQNYSGDGKNRIVRTITKGNRTNIEAIEELLRNKLPKPTTGNVPPGARGWGGYPPGAQQDSGPQRVKPAFGFVAQGRRDYEDRLLPPDDCHCSRRGSDPSRPSGYSAYDPSLNFSDRTRGPGNFHNQSRRQSYDPSLDFSDRSRGPANLENQQRIQGYDPSLDFSDRSGGPAYLGNQQRRQGFDPSVDFSDNSRRPGNYGNQPRSRAYDANFGLPGDRPQGTGIDYFPSARQTPNAANPARVCERCSGSDQNVTFCCCFTKSPKQKARSRPASPQRPCQCCGQCPPRCICEKDDLAPISLYQNATSVPDVAAQIGDGIFPSTDFMTKGKSTPVGGVAEINGASINGNEVRAGKPRKKVNVFNYLGSCCNGKDSKQTIVNVEGAMMHYNSTAGSEKAENLEDVAKCISSAGLDTTKSKASCDRQMAGCFDDGQDDRHISPEGVPVNVDPETDVDKKRKFVEQMLGCDCDASPQIRDGIHSLREFKSKEKISPEVGVAEIHDASIKGVKQLGPNKPRQRGNIFKYLCSCCNCKDSQQTIVNDDGVLPCTSGKCLDKSKSVRSVVEGISRTGLDVTSSRASSVGGKSGLQMLSCECDGQVGGPTSTEEAQLSVDKKDKFVKAMLGCDCDGPNNGQTVQEKFADETKKGQLIQKMMSCTCEDPKIEDFPSEELISFENYEEQYFDDIIGIDELPKDEFYGETSGEYHGDHSGGIRPAQNSVSVEQHNCACEGPNVAIDLEAKRNVVERRLDRHGFGNRHDCEKKRTLVQTRMGCVCNAEEATETARKQRILEDRLDCQCRPVGDPRKMSEYVRSGLGCGRNCDEHIAREMRRKQAIVERRLNCTANQLRDTDKKSAYLKRRLDCICDDVGTQAKKQQEYLERFLSCGCTNVARDIQKKKQFIDDYLRCECDKESEVKKMQLYLERFLSCDCEHTKEKNMDKKIDYMNKVMSCDGPSCKAEKEAKEVAEKEGKEEVTVCGDGTASVAEVTRRLPADPRAWGSDTLLCCCGSGESFLGPCRCDSLTDVEKSSTRRHRRGVPSSVAGGLICRCGKEGDSECVCDGGKAAATPATTPRDGPKAKAKCKCRHRLDGICRCRGKARDTNSKAPRSYLVNQVPCGKTARAIDKSATDTILCSAKKGECNCELDPESCFCSDNSTTKTEDALKEGSDSDNNTSEPTLPEAEEEANASEETQDEDDQIKEETKEEEIEETVDLGVGDECVCKKNCFGKCKCDIDGSDCSHGKQARRCYCDSEGPETCICAMAASPQRQIPYQGTCYCTKDAAGRCKCDFAGKGLRRTRDSNEARGTCHCSKDASGQCKCDKGRGAKRTKTQNTHKTQNNERGGIFIEIKNMSSKPEVSISGLETRKGNLKVSSGSTDDDDNELSSQKHSEQNETQIHFVESSQNEFFVLKKPRSEQFSSDSCSQSADDVASCNEYESADNKSASDHEFESATNTSASGNELHCPPNKSAIDNECQLSSSESANVNAIQYAPVTSANGEFSHPPNNFAIDNECQSSPDESTSDNAFVCTQNKSVSYAYVGRDSTELSKHLEDQIGVSPSVSTVRTHDTQSGPSSTELRTVQVGPSQIGLQSVQVGPSATEIQAMLVTLPTAGRSSVLGEGRRPKWYHMFQISNGKSRKRRQRGSENDSGHSADGDDCS